ncbi:MAG: GH32 C-terminal domain-containing protein [Acholeplasmatales bacterium]|nr:GH32 C-terminal domain-containing protein [Acholeplasmatales bacterium]
MEYTLDNANSYINENISKINNKYRLKFHMMPPIGWMNDPNGLVKFQDKYHLFYQYYPYEAKWGPMHWGHFSSYDLIKYNNEPVALAPENQDIESGCWSGGAIAVDNKLNLIYTRHYENNNFKQQQQYLAHSYDGLNFEKELKPLFDNNDLPSNVSRVDFRDPFPIYKNGNYYILVGGKLDTDEGVLLVLKSDHLGDFKYDFMIGPLYEFGNMCECPTYYNVDGIDIVLASGCVVQRRDNNFKNCNSSFYIAGYIDFEAKKIDIIKIDELDKGDTFYAPQFINGSNEPIMIAWMEMWGKKYPTEKDGWVGAFSIPRKLNWKNNTLYQTPIDNIKNYYKKTYNYQGEEVSRISDIYIECDCNFNIVFKATNGSFEIGSNDTGVYLDTTNSNNLNECIRYTNYKYKNSKIRVLLDVSSVEIFVDNGKESITSRVYLDSNYKLKLSNKNIKILINEIEV